MKACGRRWTDIRWDPSKTAISAAASCNKACSSIQSCADTCRLSHCLQALFNCHKDSATKLVNKTQEGAEPRSCRLDTQIGARDTVRDSTSKLVRVSRHAVEKLREDLAQSFDCRFQHTQVRKTPPWRISPALVAGVQALVAAQLLCSVLPAAQRVPCACRSWRSE